MLLTDTHAHVFDEAFHSDVETCLEKSVKQGVQRVFVPNIDENTIGPLKQICRQFPEHYFPMMGLHPCSVNEHFERVLQIIYHELLSDTYYGIGEIGMDLYWDKSTYPLQYSAFKNQAQWAIQLNLPVSVHSRNATGELIELIQRENLSGLRGIFHCFSGTEKEARTLIDMGFYLGIGGVITFKNSGLAAVLKPLGPEKLVLETDAPYLAPVPHRGKRNETSFLPLIAQSLAAVFEVSPEEIAEITTNNSKEIFGI